MNREDKIWGRRPLLPLVGGVALFVTLVVLGLLFAYFGWWGGMPVYPPPTIP